jgi:uncharacterized protein (DUF1330 family)
MSKAYWISAYRTVRDEEALFAYAKLAGPALIAGGGRFLARGVPARVYESGLAQRTVVIEFDSVAQAVAAHDSPEYRRHCVHWATARTAICALSRVLDKTNQHRRPA